MPIIWKKSKKFRPEVILNRIDGIRTVSPTGGVSYSGFDLYDALPALQSMLEFPPSASDVQKLALMRKALGTITTKLTPETLIFEINKHLVAQLATKSTTYHILTSLSLNPTGLARRIKIEGATINFLTGQYPKKYSHRANTIAEVRPPVEPTAANYCRVIVSVIAKTPFGAITKALRALDAQRAIWCLFGNSGMEIIGQEWKPINVVRLGSEHTIHHPDGSMANGEVWFEPNYAVASIYRPSRLLDFRKNTKWAMRRLTSAQYGTALTEALLRYVRALDERDQNNAFIKLWGAVESITSPEVAKYDLLIQRCSFLFNDTQYHKQILEHLREYRNSSVHAGDQNELAKSHCFQLQYYFVQLFLFHLRNGQVFSSLDEANQFLDLPPDKAKLLARQRMIQKALKFVSGI